METINSLSSRKPISSRMLEPMSCRGSEEACEEKLHLGGQSNESCHYDVLRSGETALYRGRFYRDGSIEAALLRSATKILR